MTNLFIFWFIRNAFNLIRGGASFAVAGNRIELERTPTGYSYTLNGCRGQLNGNIRTAPALFVILRYHNMTSARLALAN